MRTFWIRALAAPALGFAMSWSSASAQPPEGPPPGRQDRPAFRSQRGDERDAPGPRGRPGPGGPFQGGPSPVIAALDLDRDGEISAEEIRDAARSLKALDRDGDGKLTPEELRPRPMGPGGPPPGDLDGPPRGQGRGGPLPGRPPGPGRGRGPGRGGPGGPPPGEFGGPPPGGPDGPPDDGRPPVRPRRPQAPEDR
ncbi:MAG: hypothetical protein AB7I30_00200 [Isosphaeraceae bacterium]